MKTGNILMFAAALGLIGFTNAVSFEASAQAGQAAVRAGQAARTVVTPASRVAPTAGAAASSTTAVGTSQAAQGAAAGAGVLNQEVADFLGLNRSGSAGAVASTEIGATCLQGASSSLMAAVSQASALGININCAELGGLDGSSPTVEANLTSILNAASSELKALGKTANNANARETQQVLKAMARVAPDGMNTVRGLSEADCLQSRIFTAAR